MPFTAHLRKRESKSGITTYQIVAEEEAGFSTGKRKRFYRTVKGSKKEAEKAMRNFINELENRTFTKDSKIKVKDFMHQWLELYIKDQLSPTTVQHYVVQTENYIIPVFGDMYLQQVKNIDVQKWIFSLQKKSPLTGKPMAPKTIKNIFLNLSAAMKKAVILNILSAMIRFKKSLKENTIRERDLIIRFFIEMDAHSYYSDEIAVACLELTKFSHNRRVFECVKKYYFLHPEKICQIINERTDGFFEDYEFEWYYELPKCTFESFDDLKSFIQFIIENVNVDYKSVAYELIGRLLARALDTEITEKNILIFKIVDNYNNKRMDSGFIVGYDSLNLVRTVEDGTDQKRIYDVINNMAENIEIDFPHSALLLQKISKQYLDNSKTDFITSELGFEVL